jgi:hypothetical protein
MVAGIRLKLLLLVCSAITPCLGQSQTKAGPPQAGLEMPWDVKTILGGIKDDLNALKVQVGSMKPQEWHDRASGPTTYILQKQGAEQQLNDALAASALLDAKTESLPLALDEYFRLEALDVTIRSLAEGASRYGARSAADQVNQILARDFNNRERLREYLKDLASSIEQNFKVADAEAQRCRAIISTVPPAAKRSHR